MVEHAHEHLHGADHALIDIHDFCFAYEDEPTLRHVDLAISQGDCAVLMGPNGCGKSTLLKVINGLIFPEVGSYSFDGRSVTKKSMDDSLFSRELHQRIGFIFQDSDVQLFCNNVGEEIAFGPRQMGLSEDEVEKRCDDVMALLDIEALRDRAPYHLSGGEKKKVAIACILSMNPDVLCFDEPLNGLDVKTRTLLLDLLKQLKESGKTLVIATHDQSLADELADYFIFMGDEHGVSSAPHLHINQRS